MPSVGQSTFLKVRIHEDVVTTVWFIVLTQCNFPHKMYFFMKAFSPLDLKLVKRRMGNLILFWNVKKNLQVLRWKNMWKSNHVKYENKRRSIPEISSKCDSWSKIWDDNNYVMQDLKLFSPLPRGIKLLNLLSYAIHSVLSIF